MPFIYETEEYPEAKALTLAELKALYRQFSSTQLTADLVGASEAFVRQTLQQKKYRNSRRPFRPAGHKTKSL